MTNQKHVHKLKKVRFKSGNVTFFCALPDCTFKINPALALGKTCECWRCGKTFILGEYALRLVKPHCDECHHSKNEKIEITGVEFKPEELFIHTNATPPETSTMSLADRLKQTIKEAEETEQDI